MLVKSCIHLIPGSTHATNSKLNLNYRKHLVVIPFTLTAIQLNLELVVSFVLTIFCIVRGLPQRELDVSYKKIKGL